MSKTNILITVAIVIAVGLIAFGVNSAVTDVESVRFQPTVVVEKIATPANPSLLASLTNPVAKTDLPKMVFKKSTSEPTFYLVCDDRWGKEYNVKVDKVTFTRFKLLDTLWMEE